MSVPLQPAWARKFEPASICNGESADLVLFLMNLDHPDKRVVDAIQYAVKWFQDSKIYNTRVDVIPAPRMETPASALPPLTGWWYRIQQLHSSGRDIMN